MGNRYLKTLAIGLGAVALNLALFVGLSLLITLLVGGRGPGSAERALPFVMPLLVAWKAGMIYIAVRIAREKGRSPLVWGIVELLSSLLGTAVLLLMPYTAGRKAEIELPNTGIDVTPSKNSTERSA